MYTVTSHPLTDSSLSVDFYFGSTCEEELGACTNVMNNIIQVHFRIPSHKVINYVIVTHIKASRCCTLY